MKMYNQNINLPISRLVQDLKTEFPELFQGLDNAYFKIYPSSSVLTGEGRVVEFN